VLLKGIFWIFVKAIAMMGTGGPYNAIDGADDRTGPIAAFGWPIQNFLMAS